MRCLQRFWLTLRVGNATINVLSDDDLREIFYHCCHVNDVTWLCRWNNMRWKPLVHVCQRWRRIVFASPNYLNLQLLCDNMTPNARDSLDIWPPLPIGISYQPDYANGDQNIIAALEHHDRIIKIIFSDEETPRPVVESLSAFMQEPLPALIELDLWGESEPVLPEAFLGGSAPCLLSCTLRGIGFPGLPKLLVSTTELVSLVLHEIPDSGYIPPDAMGSCLATLPNLDRLNIDFSLSLSRPRLTSPPPPARDILPSLTHFDLTGGAEYLEDLVARIDAPCLHHLVVTFAADFDFIPSKLVGFISRSQRIEDLHRNDDRKVELDPWSVRMTDKSGGQLEFGIRHNQSSWQLESLENLCDNLSPLLSQVERLRIRVDSRGRRQPKADMNLTQWLDVFFQFPAVYYLSISRRMASVVVRALGRLGRDEHEEVLPELSWMDFDFLNPRGEEVLDDFITDRRHYAHRRIDFTELLGPSVDE